MEYREPPPRILGRPYEEVVEALNVVEYAVSLDPRHAWANGALCAGQWLVGYEPLAPITGEPTPVRWETVADELTLAGCVVQGFATAPLLRGGSRPTPDVNRAWAAGASAMLRYAIGYSDEPPIRLRRPRVSTP